MDDDEIVFWLDHLHEQSADGQASREGIRAVWHDQPDRLLTALREARYVIRCRAADALGMQRDPAAVPALLDALHDEVDSVRGHAANALGLIQDVRATDALITMLADPDVWLRWAAAEALGTLGNPSATIPLLNAWLNADHEALLIVIAEAFRRMGDAVKPSLVQAQNNPDENIQRASAYMLGQLGAVL